MTFLIVRLIEFGREFIPIHCHLTYNKSTIINYCTTFNLQNYVSGKKRKNITQLYIHFESVKIEKV